MKASSLFLATALSVVDARSSWTLLENEKSDTEKNSMRFYWYTIDDEELGPIIRPTVNLIFDKDSTPVLSDEVSLCISYRHTAGTLNHEGEEWPADLPWETIKYTTLAWEAQEWK